MLNKIAKLFNYSGKSEKWKRFKRNGKRIRVLSTYFNSTTLSARRL